MSAAEAGLDVLERRAEQIAEFRRGLSEQEYTTLAAERAAARQRLSATRRPERVLEVAQNAIARGEQVQRRHLETVPPLPVACRAGCHWCCHLRVLASAPEVLLLAEYLQNAAPAGLLAVTQERAARLAKDSRIFSAEAKAEAHIPCAMLTEQGACSVYAVRPLICRGYTSADPEPCRRMLDDDQEFVPLNEAFAREYAVVSLGLLSALVDVNLPAELLELTAGIHIALTEPNALQRWLAGESIFKDALADRDE